MSAEFSPTDIITHYARRTEVNWGRGEGIRIIAESLEEREPATAKALLSIAEEIISECETTCEELTSLLVAISHGAVPSMPPATQLFAPHLREPKNWTASAHSDS